MKTADPAFTAQWNGVLRRWALILLVLILAAIWAGWRNIGKGVFSDCGRLLTDEKFEEIVELTRRL